MAGHHLSDQAVPSKKPQPDPAEFNAFFPSPYSLCHGPAGFLAVGDSDIYRGYKICAFPDAIDAKTLEIGYMPGHVTWKFGERLEALGFEILHDDISGMVHQDRKLLTGDSPFAGNNLGRLAAEAMLKEFAA